MTEPKKILKTEPQLPHDTPLSTVPESQQPRIHTTPASSQPYAVTDTPDERQWAPGIRGQPQVYVPQLTHVVPSEPSWLSFTQPGMEPYSPGYLPEMPNSQEYFPPSPSYVNPEFYPAPYLSPTDPRDSGQFPVHR